MRPFSDEEIRLINEREVEQTKQDFEGFKESLANNLCWICKQPLDSFSEGEPCMHWLLNPHGFKKKYFPLIYQNFSVDRIESFLRWLVAAEAPLHGINDLKDEHDASKIMDLTIKYNNLEWSFSCAEGDLKGSHGNHPSHYHFQMRIDGLPFINYSDYHIPLSDYDKWVIDIKRDKIPQMKHTDLYGMGVGAAIYNIEPEVLLKSMHAIEDETNAPFHLQTIIMAEPGKMISGNDIADLIKESRSTKVPFATLARSLDNVKVRTIISPGDGIPKAALRKKRNHSKNKRRKKH